MELWRRNMLEMAKIKWVEIYIHVPKKKYFPPKEFPYFQQVNKDTWGARLPEKDVQEYIKKARRWGLEITI